MSRHRSISTDIGTDSRVAELAEHGPLPLLLFTWAIPHADDWGRMTGHPRQFKLLVCPGLEVTAKDVEQALTHIAEVGLWLRYEAAGKWYIAFAPSSWFRHQNYIPREKRGKDKSAYPAPGPQYPAFQLSDEEVGTDEQGLPQIPADPRRSPQTAEDRRESPRIPSSPSPSPSPSPIPTVDTYGGDTSGERIAPAASAAPTRGALALASSPASPASSHPQIPKTPARTSAVIIPLQPPAPKRSQAVRAPDPLWDACVLACDGDGPTNDVERGKWNKGLKALRQSGATPEELAIRAARYRRRYGPDIPLNPMALASNWNPLAQEVTHHASTADGSNSRQFHSGSHQRSAGAGGRRASRTPEPLPDADELIEWARREKARGVNIIGL